MRIPGKKKKQGRIWGGWMELWKMHTATILAHIQSFTSIGVVFECAYNKHAKMAGILNVNWTEFP